jgi:hypothetical protein
MRRLAFALVLVLGACAGTPQTRATAALATACGSIGTTFTLISPYVADGSLSDAGVSVVVGIRDATAPYCSPASTVDPVMVVDFVEISAAQLSAIFGGI